MNEILPAIPYFPSNPPDKRDREVSETALHQEPSLTRSSSPRMSESSARRKLNGALMQQPYIAIPAGMPGLAHMHKLPGERFFKEIDKLVQEVGAPDNQEQYEKDIGKIIHVFLNCFEEKALDFKSSSTNHTHDEKNARLPIHSFQKMMWYFSQEEAQQGDAALHRVIQKIPQYARPVPKRAYCTWEGGEINQTALTNLATFLKLNPDYALTVLTNNPHGIVKAAGKRHDGKWLLERLHIKRQDYSSKPLLESAINRENNGPYSSYASGSDMARVYALWKKDKNKKSGGVYFDVDCKFKKPLPPLFAPLGIQTLWKPGYFLNGLMAAPEDSEVLEESISNFIGFYDDRGKKGWSEDMWVNKRAGTVASIGKADLGDKRRPSDFMKKISADLDGLKDKPENDFWKQNFTETKERFIANPREVLTEETTVGGLYDTLKSHFGDQCLDYRENLNKFGALHEEYFDLPYEKRWNTPDRAKRRATID